MKQDLTVWQAHHLGSLTLMYPENGRKANNLIFKCSEVLNLLFRGGILRVHEYAQIVQILKSAVLITYKRVLTFE